MAKYKSKNYFNAGYQYLDIIDVPLKFSLTSKKVLEESTKLIKKAKKIVDLGCGLGGTLQIFRRLNPGAKLIGVDFSQVAIDRAAGYMRQDKNINFINCDLSSDFPRNISGVEVVYTSQLLEHLDKPVEFLKNVEKILSPGGVVIISTVYRKPWAKYIYKNRRGENVLAPDHINEYNDPEKLLDQVKKAGFEIEICKWVNFKYPITDPILRIFDKDVKSLRLFQFLNSKLLMFLRYYLAIPILGFYNIQVIAKKLEK